MRAPKKPLTDRVALIVLTALIMATAVLIGAGAGRAGAPTEGLKTQVGRVRATLQDPAMQGPEHRAERQAVIRDVLDTTIDFTEISRQALGPAWEARTPAEREEFVTAFGSFLKGAYLGQLDRYQSENIFYDGERVDGNVATVTARVESKDGDPTPLAFKLIRGADGEWRIYDIVVDGMSLTDNYRAQFAKILKSGSFPSLVQQIKDRARK